MGKDSKAKCTRGGLLAVSALVLASSLIGFSERAEAQGAPAIVWKQQASAYGVMSVVVSKDGRTVVTSGEAIHFWDLRTGALLRTIPHQAAVIALSPDGQLLASAAEEWDPAEGRYVPIIRLWHTDDGSLHEEMREHPWGVYALAFSPDGNLLASGDSGRETKLWDPATGEVIVTFNAASDAVVFSPDGSIVAGVGQNAYGRLWSTSSFTIQRAIYPWVGTDAVDFTPDGTKLVTGGTALAGVGGVPPDVVWPAVIKVWNAATGAQLRTIYWPNDTVRSLAVSPDGNYVAAGCTAKAIRIHRLADGSLAQLYDTETGTGTGSYQGVWSLAYSPDGRYLVYGRDDGMVVVAANPFGPPPACGLLGAEALPLLAFAAWRGRRARRRGAARTD